MEITGFGQTASGAQQNGALSQLTEKFDNFLLLLTKQLQHQDPLSPMDTNEFTAQLVQFTGVEQAINTNRKLDELIGLQWTNQAVNALSFLDKDVEIESSEIQLTDGKAEIRYELNREAELTKIVILDASGKPVRIAEHSGDVGEHSFVWDGKDNNGVALPDGVYSVEVSAVDADGKNTAVGTWTVGRVTGVEVDDGGVILSIGDLKVSADKVRSVYQPGAT